MFDREIDAMSRGCGDSQVSRIRSYHVCLLLALFNAVVILLTLQVHSETTRDAELLIEKAGEHDEHSKWLQRAEERIVRLNAPATEVFLTQAVEDCASRFNFEKVRMIDVINEGREIKQLGPLPEDAINQIFESGDQLFEEYAVLSDKSADEQSRHEATRRAGWAMARMDAAQREALTALGIIESRNTALRDEMLLIHQRDLEKRARDERYLIAAVLVILVGILGFGRRLYLTERSLDIERRRLREERRERLAAVGELCSSVAHGIRNPLAGIRSSAQLTLQLGQLDPASRTRLQDVLEEGRRLGDRVTGLLALSRATADGFAAVNLTHVIKSATDGLASELTNRGIALDLQLPPSEVTLQGDQAQLEQVVIELISNAMDHSNSGDRIVVSCERPNANGRVEIAVQDQGSGVGDELKDNLFDLFMTTKPGGTGIGLATARRYARLHGGDVRLASSEKGARFVVDLPSVAVNKGGDVGA